MSITLILILVALIGAAGAVGVGVVVVKAASNRQLTAAPAPKQIEAGGLADGDVLDSTVKDLKRGALIEVTGFGDEFEDVQLEVEAYTRYARARDEWHELQSSYRARQVGILWDVEAGTDRVWAAKHLRGKSLADIGQDAAGFDALTKGASIEVDGTSYSVTDVDKALSHKDGTGFGKEHRSWELLAADGKSLLRVEQWRDDAHLVTLCEALDPAAITIYRLKAKG